MTLAISGTTGITLAGQFDSASTFGFKNRIINGNFDIWQRGTTNTLTTSGYTVADRWQYLTDGTLSTGTVFTQQTFTIGQTAVPNNPRYFLQIAYTSVNTPSNYIRQRIENVATLSGQTATFSFWAKVSSGTLSISAQFQQEFGSGGSPSGGIYGIGSTSFTATTTWQQFTFTTTIPSISGKTVGTNNDSALNAAIVFPASGTATVQIAQVQVEQGSIATSFDVRFLGTELALCQRYYFKNIPGVAGSTVATGAFNGTTNLVATPIFPVPMRTAPTMTQLTMSLGNGVTSNAVTSIGTQTFGVNSGLVVLNGTSASYATAQAGYVFTQATTSYIDFNAEL